MEFMVLKLTRLLGAPTVTSNPTTRTEKINKAIQQQDTEEQLDVAEQLDEEEDENETLTFEYNDDNSSPKVNFFIDILYPDEIIQIRHNELNYDLSSVEELEHMLSLMPQWSQLLSLSLSSTIVLHKLAKWLEYDGGSGQVRIGKPFPFGCLSIENDRVLIFNNPFEWDSLSENCRSANEFSLVVKSSSDTEDKAVVLNRQSLEDLVQFLSQSQLLHFEWTSEVKQLADSALSSCYIWKIDRSDEHILKVLSSNQDIDPTDQLLLFEMTESRDRWAKIVRDESFQVWKCFIGIPADSQSILFEQSHTMIQYLDSVNDLSLNKLTFSGKMKRGSLKKSFFPSAEQYVEFCGIKADDMWWFGFDYNHTPIAHFQVFEAMKKKNMSNVPTLDKYLLENPEDFADVSPLEYSTNNWIKTSLEIDRAVTKRSYKTIDTCRAVIDQVNNILFQNEEIFLQVMRYEMIEQEEDELEA